MTDKSGSHLMVDMDIEVSGDEVMANFPSARRSKAMDAALEKNLALARERWRPMAAYRWLAVAGVTKAVVRLDAPERREPLALELGYAARFLGAATEVLVAVYTLGREFDASAEPPRAPGDYLDRYLMDEIGLVALDKVGRRLCRMVERRAGDRGWGVGPFLSPGSVHGWDLAGQVPLCSLLPLDRVGVELRESATLFPHKSLTCLMGIGPDYPSRVVGSTCEVCSRRENCSMRNDRDPRGL